MEYTGVVYVREDLEDENNFYYLDDELLKTVDLVGEEKYLQLVNEELSNGFPLATVVHNLYDVYIGKWFPYIILKL